MALTFKIRSQSFTAATLKEASEIYCRERDDSGEGASTFSPANVRDGGKKMVAHISYNGKVWKSPHLGIDGTLLYNPYAEA